MSDDHSNSSPLDVLKRYVPLAVWTVAILVLIAIPLKIIGYGFLPGDDALRHAARAVSGKPWSEILVLNPTYKIDHEFGWNWLLGKIHDWSDWNAEALVIFSVVALFVLVNAAVLPWLGWPEAWLITLLGAMIFSEIPQRFMLGRPYIVTIAGLMTILLLWQRHGLSPPKRWMIFFMAGVVAVSTFFHGAWYLWVLLAAAFLFAGQFRWGLAFAACWAGGVLIGATFTGHPIAYPLQAVKLALLATGLHATERTMATELQPFGGDFMALVTLGGLLILRQLAKLNSIPLTKNPAFWLGCICWMLAFKVGRFWDDWGWPALLVLMAVDLQSFLRLHFATDSFKRFGLTCFLAAATYLCVTADTGSRWTANLTEQYLSVAEHPADLAGWMPGKGGIFYTADMTLFYQTFFKNPHGDWRYMLGFEPTWMPKEDFEIYQKILWNFGDAKAYEPWVKQMKPADRLAIRGDRGSPPNIPQLEWNYGVSGIWIGRLPRPVLPGTAPPTIPATAAQNSTNSVPVTGGSAK
ncbi:MAG TPA: hypothetical protein VMD27_10595 [Candidatus Aquilonibacter sp.]|nr:hypothetical protein [Candidatus Aquilonibacter sp.]